MRNIKAEAGLRHDGMTLAVARKAIEHLEATDPQNIILHRGRINANSKSYLELGESIHMLTESEEFKEIRRSV